MWPNPQETAYLVTFIEEILNGKLHFLCSVIDQSVIFYNASNLFGGNVISCFLNPAHFSFGYISFHYFKRTDDSKTWYKEYYNWS